MLGPLRNLAKLTASRPAAGVAALVLGIAGTALYASVLNGVYPLRQWLFWPLAMLWGWCALFSVACTSFGQMVLVRVLRLTELPALESAVLSMALGVVGFVLAMYVGGAFALYGEAWAVALPLAMIATSAQDGLRLWRRMLADLKQPVARGPLAIAITACGVLCVGVVYLGAMTPAALNYDSQWYHLVVAQDYAREGRIVAFPADYNKNFPQLTALIHTWGWLLPGMTDPLRWMMALHQEFGLFLWTLAGVAAGIRNLVADLELRGAWVAFFLFPVIFVYDHNLGGAADHVAAFFAVPIMLAALRTCAGFSPASAALLGATSAGALLTKYQAIYLPAAVAAVAGVIWLRYLFEHFVPRFAPGGTPRVALRNLLLAPALTAAVGLLLFSPHLLRNLIFYGNPVYPLMHSVFHSSPNIPHSAYYFDVSTKDPNFQATGTLAQKLVHAIKLFFTFSFAPHYSFTHDVPVFGSLFTLLLPALPFVQQRKRIAIAAAIASISVLIWAWVFYVDRNLQIFMPVMVCVTGALLVQLWRSGRLARAGLVPLLALQLVWGGDALFYSGHERIRSAMELISSGFDGKADQRFDHFRSEYVAIDKLLPRNAVVLLHTWHLSLGIDRKLLFDWSGFQGLIGYDHVHTPRELYDYLRSFGITHLVYEVQLHFFAPSKQEEVVWNALVTGYSEPMGQFGPYRLARLPDKPPPAEAPYRVATAGLWGYADGVYPIAHLATMEYLPGNLQRFRQPSTPMPADPAARAALLEGLDAIIAAPKYTFDGQSSEVLQRRFKRVAQFTDRFVLYLRKERVAHPR